MGFNRFRYKSTEEKIGAIILAPLRLVLMIIALPLIIIAYPFVAIWIFFCIAEGSPSKRLKPALAWPVGLLALNELFSLNGMDNPVLSRITEWLNRRFDGRTGRSDKSR